MNPERIDEEARRIAKLQAQDPGLGEQTQKEADRVVRSLGPGESSLFFRLLEEYLKEELGGNNE